MSDLDWGGPYVSIMTLCRSDGGDPVEIRRNDQGSLVTIRNIGDRAAINQLGDTVELRLLIVLYSGDRPGHGGISLTIVEPNKTRTTVGPLPVTYDKDPAELVRLELPIIVEAHQAGTYWIEARAGRRLMSKIPFHVDLMPGIPPAFLET